MTANRKKKQSGGSLKGFLIFVLIVAGGVFLYQQGGLPDFSHKEKIITSLEKQIEKADGLLIPEKKEENKVPEKKLRAEKTPLPPKIQPSSRMELPVELTKRNGKLLERSGYTLSYNLHYKTPDWVAWELTKRETLGKNVRINRFSPDPNLPEPRVTHSDYTNSGYDRGHMAPAADMKWSQQAMLESFYMSNVCPQNQKLNRDDWNDLEEACRRWAKKYNKVYIVCGPVYDTKHPKRIGQHKVAVPDRFFKAVLINDKNLPKAMGFIFPNKAHHQKLENYMLSIDSLEKITGLDFFSPLPDNIENRIEQTVPALPN